VPKSKSKRSRYQPPPKPKPPPSPRWVPVLFGIALGLGFATIITRYFLGDMFPIVDKDYLLWIGLGLIGLAFVIATQWR
jgi:hypothetical protein